jgi:hypothetical protein
VAYFQKEKTYALTPEGAEGQTGRAPWVWLGARWDDVIGAKSM